METDNTSKVTFTLGTEDKMDMGLDDIIKQSGAAKKKRGNMSIKRGTTQRGGRGRNFGKDVAARSSFQRQKGVNKMRGIQSTTQQKEKKVVTTRKRFPVRKVGQTVKDAAWRKQQAQRRLNQAKKLQRERRALTQTLTVRTNSNTNNSSGNQNGTTSRRASIRRRTTGVARGLNRARRTVTNTQNRQDRIATSRGITKKNPAPKTLNERFSAVRGRGRVQRRVTISTRVARGGRGRGRGNSNF